MKSTGKGFPRFDIMSFVREIPFCMAGAVSRAIFVCIWKDHVWCLLRSNCSRGGVCFMDWTLPTSGSQAMWISLVNLLAYRSPHEKSEFLPYNMGLLPNKRYGFYCHMWIWALLTFDVRYGFLAIINVGDNFYKSCICLNIFLS